jgi:hypothetical protein
MGPVRRLARAASFDCTIRSLRPNPKRMRPSRPQIESTIVYRYRSVMAAGDDWRPTPPVGSKALSDRLAIIDDLLDHGASPTDADRVGSTPLHFAVSWDFAEGAQRLLDRCAGLRCDPSPPDVKDDRGRTPLEHAQAKRKTVLTPTAIAQADRMIATLEAWSRRSD